MSKVIWGGVSLLVAAGAFALDTRGSKDGGGSAEVVVGGVPGAGGLEVDFSATPTSGTAPLAVELMAVVVAGEATTMVWDLGDGTTLQGMEASHVYAAAGDYSITLMATGPEGSHVLTKLDYVSVQDASGVTVDFTGTPTSGGAPLTVAFTSDVQGAVPIGGLWEFGDGATAAQRSPSHVYADPGTYTVTLTIQHAGGTAGATKVDYITVTGDPPTSSIVLTNANTAAELDDMFTSGGTQHSGGAAWIDYNSDLLPDLLITNGTTLQNLLYRNDGDGTFTNVSSVIAKPDAAYEVAGVKFGDFDNDGDSDVLMPVDNASLLGPLNGGPNLFYVNQGDGTFVEDAAARGLLDPLGRRNVSSGIADYDRDGALDVYLGCWNQGSTMLDTFNTMLRNDGTANFTDTTAATGTDGLGRDTLVLLWFDANLDGWPDLYVGNAGEEPNGTFEPDNDDVIYLNDCGGATVFCDVTGPQGVIGNDAKAAMGFDVGDIDNDGDWDFYGTDNPVEGPAPLGNVLYLGNGDGTFADNSCDVAGVCVGAGTWPCNFADFDRDGNTDLWVGTSSGASQDYLYRNNGDGTFTDQSLPALTGNNARGGTVGDYDGDGDMDLVIVNYSQDSVLLRNDSTDTNNWLEFKLTGVSSNRDAIGAVVKVTTPGRTQMRRVSGGDSAHSQMDLILHFGLDTQIGADVTVEWPSGTVQNFTSVLANQLVLVDEVGGILREAITVLDVVHDESERELVITARSNYGGRTTLEVEGFGPLAYDASRTSFEGVFRGVAEAPAEVVVRGERGARSTGPVLRRP